MGSSSPWLPIADLTIHAALHIVINYSAKTVLKQHSSRNLEALQYSSACSISVGKTWSLCALYYLGKIIGKVTSLLS